ncbi:DUF3048 domain-containing protein [Cuneatibacter sp. NSJ-177]|uniref:DUF3048 domain-containing protein n=1 Tax=Cuneatibacter sp. NSJ-177 TaxID=2931401 RepID=UPI001FD1DA4B|nr:DUF3048 domain-containing protein [Cuneatibacter sp. NSJ-177]MCJ7836425.1 DUF3048 domain-containing protein [Cuneatibacter sp. NSJ-177]
MKKRNMKLFSLTLAAAMAFTMLGGCSKKQDEITTEAPTSTEAGTMASVTMPAPPETTASELPEGMMYSYLTGLPVTTEVGTKRPLAVMIDNEKKAMPQNGVSSADVVYETPIEANEVRLEMIIQDYSELSRFGGLRSARRYHPGIAYEFDAIFFHHGHSDIALPYLEDTEHCDDIDGVTDRGYAATYEVDDHAQGHRTFSNPEKINTRIEKLGVRTEVRSDFDYKFKFAKESAPNTLPNGTAANKVSIGYKQNQPWFEYHSDDQLYYRYAYGEAHIDQENNQQVAVKNIIVQYCDFELEWDKDTKNIYTTGEGSGVFITGGKSEPITWSKAEYWGNTHYFDANGQEIELNPGKTWVCIVLPKMTGEITVE